MSGWRFVFRSLVYHWRVNLAVALGVAAATAVLTGALLVGDSVRGSLRRLTLDRLGRIDEVLLTDRFFRTELAEELSENESFQQHFHTATPAILFPRGTVEKPGGDRPSRATQVVVVGCDEAFWDLGDPQIEPKQLPGQDEIVLNAPLAKDLGASVGDEVVLRLPKSNQVPADSPLGRKTDRIGNARLKVVDIVPADGLGRFSLTASQTTPRNAYVDLKTLQDLVDQEGRVNAVFVDGKLDLPLYDKNKFQGILEALNDALKPKLADYGFSIRRIRRTFQKPNSDQEEEVYDYFTLTTDRMLFEAAAADAAERAFSEDHGQAVFTYLANAIDKLGSDGESMASIPYSLVSALDSSPELGPLFANDGQPLRLSAQDDEKVKDGIVLTSWAATELQAKPEDQLRLAFYEPETVHGEPRERTVDFTLRAVVPLTEPSSPYDRRQVAQFDQLPTRVNDPDLTPEVDGITDQQTIDKWETPFKLSRQIRVRDEEYWKNHRTTPKAFVSLSAGRKLWGSRFGATTSFRIPAPEDLPVGGEDEEAFVRGLEQKLLAQLKPKQAEFGFSFIPVKQRGLDASKKGNTDFDYLFLSLSFFVIAAALMLVALLFRLGVERRAAEVGTLLAVGFRRRLTARLLIAEGALIAALGGLVGIVAGVGYAWLMLAGLRTWWIGAIVTPFLLLHVESISLVIGYVAGVVVSVLTIAWSVWRMRRLAVRRLLAGQASEATDIRYRTGPLWHIVAAVLLVFSIALAAVATCLGGEAQAGAFVGSGATIMMALLAVIRSRLRSGGRAGAGLRGMSLASLAARNVARNPGRSTMTIGLMATASFLIVSMSAFRRDPSVLGTGGFDLVAETSEPIFANLNTEAGRKDALTDDAAALEGGVVLAFRVQPGDDASCNNLYQATQPRVLGVSDEMIRHFDNPEVPSFGWAANAAESEADRANPWRLLVEPREPDDGVVPVVIDKETAMWSLKLFNGIGEEYEVTYEDGVSIRFRVAGLLDLGILHGSLLISEDEFVKRFPDASGYRYFLVQSPPVTTDDVEKATLARQEQGLPPITEAAIRRELFGERRAKVATVLENRLGDQGFDATEAMDRLEDLQAIQNTYLSTFQSLGALGLLLGTFGLATVQVRNVVERRGELALMRAAGFRRSRLAKMVMFENTGLLLGGLLTGFLAAVVAVLPHMLLGDATVPLRDPAIMLGIVLVVGALSSLFSVRTTLRAPLLAALRGD